MSELDDKLKLVFADAEPIDMTGNVPDDAGGDMADMDGELGDMGDGLGEDGLGGDMGDGLGGDMGGGDMGGGLGGDMGAGGMPPEEGDGMGGEGGGMPTAPQEDYDTMDVKKKYDLEQIMSEDEDELLNYNIV